MSKTPSLALVTLTLLIGLGPQAAFARDGTRQTAPVTQTAPRVIPNPYAAPVAVTPATGDRAADAYSTGFAIGLGTALINKQHEDDLQRQRGQQRK